MGIAKHQSERLQAFAAEDIEEAWREASLAKRALDEGDVADARRRLLRSIELATDARSALLPFQLEAPRDIEEGGVPL